MILPDAIVTVTATAPALAFTGSRRCEPPPAALAALSFIAPGAVAVGDCRGVDAAVSRAIPWAEIFTPSFEGRGGLAERSQRLAEWAAKRQALLIGFPSSPCPKLLPSDSPRDCFNGQGSGTWATLAYGRGLGVAIALYCPRHPAPVGFGLRRCGGGWYFAP